MTGKVYKLILMIPMVLGMNLAAKGNVLLSENFETVSGAAAIPVSGGTAFYPDTKLWRLSNVVASNTSVTAASRCAAVQGCH